MSATEILNGVVWEDSEFAVLARLVDSDGTDLQQADVASVQRKTYDLSSATPTTATDTEDLTVTSAVYDTLQTDDCWTEDAEGFNFKDTVGADVLTKGGHLWRIEYKITLNDGKVLWLVAKFYCRNVSGS